MRARAERGRAAHGRGGWRALRAFIFCERSRRSRETAPVSVAHHADPARNGAPSSLVACVSKKAQVLRAQARARRTETHVVRGEHVRSVGIGYAR